MAGAGSALYDEDFGWPNLADGLALATRGDGTLLQLLADSYNGRSPDGKYDSIGESSGLIVCADHSAQALGWPEAVGGAAVLNMGWNE